MASGTASLEREPGRQTGLLCLSPLAVRPDAAGRGIARALVERVVALARARDTEPYLVLEGDPALYRRFGFVPAATLGLSAPSERIPPGAFQAVTLRPDRPAPVGRVRYDEVFRSVDPPAGPGRGVAFLDELEHQCRAIEQALTGAPSLRAAVVACPGWTVQDVIEHLGAIHRLVLAWLAEGRRPRSVPPAADGAPPVERFARTWRALHERLSAQPADAPAPTWCAYDATVGFWRRRMLHEHAVHALDVLTTLERPWTVSDAVALDGVDEALRLWLGTRMGVDVGGRGDGVRLQATTGAGTALRHWTAVLHAGVVEILDGDVPAEASVTGPAAELYRWVWGRAARVHSAGEPGAVAELRRALARVAV
jgi:uncharacterized protein (TIGR03083 family)